MFEHYQFNRDAIVRAAAAIADYLAETEPGESPEAFAGKVIAERLRAKPGDYLQYGPWWWAVKQALRLVGHDFGATDIVTLRSTYGGDLTVHQALVAGEQFREYYRTHQMAGTATFALGEEADPDGGAYTLFDMNMEIRRHGLLTVGLAEVAYSGSQGDREADEPILDQVSVPFEEGGELWTALVSIGLITDGKDPETLVAELHRSGRIGRAIYLSKGILTASAHSVGPRLTANPQARTVRIGPSEIRK